MHLLSSLRASMRTRHLRLIQSYLMLPKLEASPVLLRGTSNGRQKWKHMTASNNTVLIELKRTF